MLVLLASTVGRPSVSLNITEAFVDVPEYFGIYSSLDRSGFLASFACALSHENVFTLPLPCHPSTSSLGGLSRDLNLRGLGLSERLAGLG